MARLLSALVALMVFHSVAWAQPSPLIEIVVQARDAVKVATDHLDAGTNSHHIGFGNWAEVTIAAIAPGENGACPNGRLIFFNGQTALMTNLDGSALPQNEVNVWTPPVEDETAIPPYAGQVSGGVPAPPGEAYDAHIVKVPGGGLIVTKQGMTFDDRSVRRSPGWWTETKDYHFRDQFDPKTWTFTTDIALPGGRGIVWVYRSSDCGQTWQPLPSLDALYVTVKDPVTHQDVTGLCSSPRLMVALHPKSSPSNILDPSRPLNCTASGNHGAPANCQTYGGGGWDGPTSYVDPYTSDLWLTMPCQYSSGQFTYFDDDGSVLTGKPLPPNSVNPLDGKPFPAGAVAPNPTTEQTLVLRLPAPMKYGVGSPGWELVGQTPGHIWNGTIAASPNGKIAVAVGGSVAVFDPPYDYRDFQWTNVVTVNTLRGNLPDFGTRAIDNGNWCSSSVARDYTDLPDRYILSGCNVQGPFDFFQFSLYEIAANQDGSLNALSSSAIPIASPKAGQFNGALVEGPPGSDYAMFFWLAGNEIASPNDVVNKFSMNFAIIANVSAKSTPGLLGNGPLTLIHQNPYTWEQKGFIGDFISGASYQETPDSVVFVVPWAESGILHMGSVAVQSVIAPCDLEPGGCFGTGSGHGLGQNCQTMKKWLETHKNDPSYASNQTLWDLTCAPKPPGHEVH